MKTVKFCVISVFLLSNLSAQTALIDQLQYGISLKAKLELRKCKHQEPNFNFRLSASWGLAGRWLTDEIYPSLNCEVQFYNGGLGSRSRYIDGKWHDKITTTDFIIALTLTSGHLDKFYKGTRTDSHENVPLYYFADYAIPSLQNPYIHSLSLGTNLILSTDTGREFQRVGFLNVHAFRYGQFSYYNDGTPFGRYNIGDDKDRYYTGGGVLSFTNGHGDPENLRSYSITLSYYKFTGFTQNAFELSNALHTSNVDYKEVNEQYYNKSLWKVNLISSSQTDGFSLAMEYYNSVNYDGQHTIHTIVNNSYHVVPYGANVTFEPAGFVINNGFKN